MTMAEEASSQAGSDQDKQQEPDSESISAPPSVSTSASVSSQCNESESEFEPEPKPGLDSSSSNNQKSVNNVIEDEDTQSQNGNKNNALETSPPNNSTSLPLSDKAELSAATRKHQIEITKDQATSDANTKPDNGTNPNNNAVNNSSSSKKKKSTNNKNNKKRKKRRQKQYAAIVSQRHLAQIAPSTTHYQDTLFESIQEQHQQCEDENLPEERKALDQTTTITQDNGEEDKIANDKDDDDNPRILYQRMNLPKHHYECTLRRRAIRKASSKAKTKSNKSDRAYETDNRRSLFSNKAKMQLSSTIKTESDKEIKSDGKTQNELDEIEGDTSLGMKLTILSGQVIVQKLIPLQDGRASPAQLCGLIQRGDVLVCINGQNLTNLEDNLVEMLKPLSSPCEEEEGIYSRTIRLEFAAGEGLSLFEKDEVIPSSEEAGESNNTRKENMGSNDGAGDLFNLSRYTTVDHMTGMPLFDENYYDAQQQKSMKDKNQQTKNQEISKPTSPTSIMKPSTPRPITLTLPQLVEAISTIIATENQLDRLKHTSNFYILDDDDRVSSLLQHTSSFELFDDIKSQITTEPINSSSFIKSLSPPNRKIVRLTTDEILELAQRALSGAKILCDDIQYGRTYHSTKKVDPLDIVRSECRSFSSRSRFSQRIVTVRSPSYESSSHGNDDDDDDEDSIGSTEINNNNDDGVDGDEMLLRLAAWNKVWKEQMVEALEDASVKGKGITPPKSNNDENDVDVNDSNVTSQQQEQQQLPNPPPLATPGNSMESHLENLLFGEQVSQILFKKKEKTVALPPDEMTAVLFDLAARINSTVPSNVLVGGEQKEDTLQYQPNQPLESVIEQFAIEKVGEEISQAAHFMMDDILPVWLNTFRPLPLTQRRVLWPLVKDQVGCVSPDEEMSLSNQSAWSAGTPESRKRLEEKIADLELDADSRFETCNLVSFYFTRKILPEIQRKRVARQSNDSNDVIEIDEENEAIEFITQYGSYLKLHSSLVAASNLKAEKVIHNLLDMAKQYDPHHQEGMKFLSRNTSSILLYEAKFLSCLLVQLQERKPQQQNILLLVAAYPDLKPWQVRGASPTLNGMIESILNDGDSTDVVDSKEIEFYYEYLSLLMDGSDCARKESTIVKEWCILSTSKRFTWNRNGRHEKFVKMASNPGEEEESSFYRDIPLLIDLCINNTHNFPLALELASEIVNNTEYWSHESVIHRLILQLHVIASKAVDIKFEDEQQPPIDTILLRQIITLYQRIASSSSNIFRQSISVANEISKILGLCSEKNDDDKINEEENNDESESESETTTPNTNQTEAVTSKETAFVHLLADIAKPHDVLKVLYNWPKAHQARSSLVHPTLQTCLKNGAKEGTRQELSGALLRIQRVRQEERKDSADRLKASESNTSFETTGMIWNKLQRGTAVIDK